MVNVWDINARALIAFALILIAGGVVYIAFKLSEKSSIGSKGARSSGVKA
jgi:hypothetical protein